MHYIFWFVCPHFDFLVWGMRLSNKECYFFKDSSFLLKHYEQQAQKTGYYLGTSNKTGRLVHLALQHLGKPPSCGVYSSVIVVLCIFSLEDFSDKLFTLLGGSLNLSWSKCSLTYFVAVGIILGHISMQCMFINLFRRFASSNALSQGWPSNHISTAISSWIGISWNQVWPLTQYFSVSFL